ncbi:hypothetical protein HZB88_01640 [archaeon]|nr:hypothetical protein [archaeon]
MEDALEVLSKNIVPLKKSDFNLLGAYEYPLRVLVPFWGKTGEMGIKTKEGHEFYRIEKITPRQASPAVIFDDEVQKPISGDYTYTLARKSRVHMPAERGYFNRIGDTDGRGYYNGVVYEDNEGRSTVWCYWGSVVQGLYVDAGGPLGRDDYGVVGTWRKAA